LNIAAFWLDVSRLGESSVLLPLMMATAIALGVSARSVRPALTWTLSVAFASALTVAAKVAFIGFGYGIAAIDFTGPSGHAMLAASAYPMLSSILLRGTSPRWHVGALAVACLLSLAVAVSRVAVGAHSASEAAIGFALGMAASAVSLQVAPELPGHLRWVIAALGTACVLVAAPTVPPWPTQELVTRLALALSGHREPYVRADLHREGAVSRR
jgi:membrane-associated phospholipid phosphatase